MTEMNIGSFGLNATNHEEARRDARGGRYDTDKESLKRLIAAQAVLSSGKELTTGGRSAIYIRMAKRPDATPTHREDDYFPHSLETLAVAQTGLAEAKDVAVAAQGWSPERAVDIPVLSPIKPEAQQAGIKRAVAAKAVLSAVLARSSSK